MLVRFGNLIGRLRKGQLGLFGEEPKEIQKPGSRGGKFYRNKKGKVVYGTKPTEKPKSKADQVQEMLKKLKAKKENRIARKKKKADPSSLGLFGDVLDAGAAEKKAKKKKKQVETSTSGKDKIDNIKDQAALDLFSQKDKERKPDQEKEPKQSQAEPEPKEPKPTEKPKTQEPVKRKEISSAFQRHWDWHNYLTQLLNGKDYNKIENEPYEPLSIEKLHGGKQIAISHTFVQNGDLIRDPEVIFDVIEHDNMDGRTYKIVDPISIEHGRLGGLVREVYLHDENGKRTHINRAEQRDLRGFVRLWFKNIRQQGFFDEVKKQQPGSQEPDKDKDQGAGANLGININAPQPPQQDTTEQVEDKAGENKDLLNMTPVEYYNKRMDEEGDTEYLTQGERVKANKRAREIIKKPLDKITDEERAELKKYSGRGGLGGKEGGKGLLNEYYTPRRLTNFMYAMALKLGYKGGDILEPSSGTGNFIEVAPDPKKVTAVEIDPTSSKISKILNPDADIHEQPFELFQVTNDKKFDLVIGNVPFGARMSIDGNIKLDMPDERNADRYFIERSIDNAKQNGLVTVIAMHGVISNASNAKFRREIQKKAEFLGAIRLPSKTFAHTGVVSDILLFKKRPNNVIQSIEKIDDDSKIMEKIENKDFTAGKYYETIHGQENLIGEEGKKTYIDDFGNEQKHRFYQVKGEATRELLTERIKKFEPLSSPLTAGDLMEMGYSVSLTDDDGKEKGMLLSKDEVKQLRSGQLIVGMTKTINGRIYILNANHRWERLHDKWQTDEGKKKLEDINAISKHVDELRQAMKDKDADSVDALQFRVKAAIDEYVNQHGSPDDDPDIRSLINSHRKIQGIKNVLGLKQGDSYSDLLTKESIYAQENQGAKLNTNDIVAVANHIVHDLDKELRPSELAEVYKDGTASHQEIRQDLLNSDSIFFDGEVFYTETQFLQGDVYDKLDLMNYLIDSTADEELKEKYSKQIEAIQKAAGFKTIEDINLLPKDGWIPEEVRDSFFENVKKAYVEQDKSGKWEATTDPYGGYKITKESKRLAYYLNGHKQKEKAIDTKDYKETIEDEFRRFVADDPDLKKELEDRYNKYFHNYIVPQRDGHIPPLQGMNQKITLNRAQREDINMLYKAGKGISALDVGFGKTFSMIALSQYRKQTGLEKKAFFQVPNNKVKDWEKDIKVLFPNATVATIDSEIETSPEKLSKKLHEISNNHYDFVICAESKAVDIGVSEEHERSLDREIYYQWNGSDMPSRETKDKGEIRALNEFDRARSIERRAKVKDINFEDLGCDAFYVDEAHHLKNLWKPKNQENRDALGLKLSQDSTRALEAWKKAEHIRKINSDKGVFFATATPFTNTALEYYNMLSHIAPEELRARNMNTIDDFINYYAITEEKLVPNWRSNELQEKNVFVDYNNVDSLRNLLNKYVDYQRDVEKAGIKRPEAKDNKHYIPPTTDQLESIEEVRDAMKAWLRLPKEERKLSGENPLTFWGRFRAITMDLELYDNKRFKNWVNPKIKLAAETAKQRFAETGSGQVMFCDRVFNSDKDFNFHDKIKNYLVQYGGFKESEIAVVNGFTKGGSAKSDANIEKDVGKVIDQFNKGKIKVLLGTTWTLGEGVNIQDNASDLYHLDIPFRPSDYDQRNGRIHRQGNEQDQVGLHYLFGTGIDNAAYSMLQRKEDMFARLVEGYTARFAGQGDNEQDVIDYMSPLGMRYMTSESDEEKAQIIEEFKQQRREKQQQINREKSINEFKKYLQIKRSMSKIRDKNSPNYKTSQTTLQQIRKQLIKNPEFKHHDHLDLDPKTKVLYNTVRNEILKEGDAILYIPLLSDGTKGAPKMHQIDNISESKGKFSTKPYNPHSGQFYVSYNNHDVLRDQKVSGETGARVQRIPASDFDRISRQVRTHEYVINANKTSSYSSNHDLLERLKDLKFTPEQLKEVNPYLNEHVAANDRNDFILENKDGEITSMHDFLSEEEKVLTADQTKDFKNNTKIILPLSETKPKIFDYLTKNYKPLPYYSTDKPKQRHIERIAREHYFDGEDIKKFNQAVAPKYLKAAKEFGIDDLPDELKNDKLLLKRVANDPEFDLRNELDYFIKDVVFGGRYASKYHPVKGEGIHEQHPKVVEKLNDFEENQKIEDALMYHYLGTAHMPKTEKSFRSHGTPRVLFYNQPVVFHPKYGA